MCDSLFPSHRIKMTARTPSETILVDDLNQLKCVLPQCYLRHPRPSASIIVVLPVKRELRYSIAIAKYLNTAAADSADNALKFLSTLLSAAVYGEGE